MLNIGKLTNTHGLKGEVRINSSFKYKDVVFKKGNHLYIENDDLVINTHRIHKNLDMVTFDGINNINDILKYKGKEVFIKKEDFDFGGPLNEDLIGKEVYGGGKLIGTLSNVKQNVNQELLVIKNGDKQYLVPYVDAFIKDVGNSIEINVIEGLLNED